MVLLFIESLTMISDSTLFYKLLKDDLGNTLYALVESIVHSLVQFI